MLTRCVAILALCAILLPALSLPASAEVCRSVKTEKPQIALTFDDGPHPRLTPRILEILARYKVHATFFMIGKNVGDYPKTAAMVATAGHEIGNHTFSHVRLYGMSENRIRAELEECNLKIQEVCHVTPRYFRAPEGATDQRMIRITNQLETPVILWSVDTRDWECKNADLIVRRVLSSVKPGDIILMHDFIGQNSKTPEALERLIPKLLARGYELVTVGELLESGS